MFLRVLLIALCLLTIGIASPSRGADGDIEGLLNDCSADKGSANFNYCIGFVTAALDFMRVNGFFIKEHHYDKDGFVSEWALCLEGQSLTVRAAIQVFKNWAQAHPERWIEQDYEGVATAFRDIWRCRVPEQTPGPNVPSLPVPKMPP
jgi:hypothetical protein